MHVAASQTTGLLKAMPTERKSKAPLSPDWISPSNLGMNRNDKMPSSRIRLPRKISRVRTARSMLLASVEMIAALVRPTTRPAAP